MERRTIKRSVGSSEFLCLCIALGDEDAHVADEAWRSLHGISGRDAETILLDLDNLKVAEPVAEAAQLFLKDLAWK